MKRTTILAVAVLCVVIALALAIRDDSNAEQPATQVDGTPSTLKVEQANDGTIKEVTERQSEGTNYNPQGNNYNPQQ